MTTDERKTIRRLLWHWGKVTEYCARRHRDIIDFLALIEAVGDIKPQQLSGMPHGTDAGNPTERLATLRILYAERVDDLRHDIDKELRLSHDIGDLIRELEPVEQTVIDMHYREGMAYGDIARELNYCDAQVENIERGAVDKLSKRIRVN